MHVVYNIRQSFTQISWCVTRTISNYSLDLYRAFYLYFSAFYLRTLERSQYGAGRRKGNLVPRACPFLCPHLTCERACSGNEIEGRAKATDSYPDPEMRIGQKVMVHDVHLLIDDWVRASYRYTQVRVKQVLSCFTWGQTGTERHQ
jgi:hypothetical protein